jgi:hypothetical protein
VKPRVILFGVAAVVAGIAAGVAYTTDGGDDDEPGATPKVQACRMLEDGDTAVEAFDILVDLDVTELDASRAVNEAMADGCGSGD